MKKLICVKDVETFQKTGGKVCYIDSNTIITPAAADSAKNLGITFSDKVEESTTCCNKEKTCEPKVEPKSEISSDMIYSALKTMLEKGMLDINMFANSQPAKPYEYECDKSGLKVVRGKSVQMDVFDTGIPSNKVFYQEVISKDESKMSAGFLVIDHSRFEWDLNYDEIDYVIEGTLEVAINGKTFTAYAGDVLLVPSGSTVTWASPDKAKMFYTTYPANWADLLLLQQLHS